MPWILQRGPFRLYEREDGLMELWYDYGDERMPRVTITDFTGRLREIIKALPEDGGLD